MTDMEKPAICPECKTQLDWWHQYLTGGVGEGMVRFWACEKCGHMFKTKGGVIVD